MSTTAWGEVLAWAKAEIETARDGLEQVTDPIGLARIQARIAVMRELQTIKNTPAAPDIPGPVSY